MLCKLIKFLPWVIFHGSSWFFLLFLWRKRFFPLSPIRNRLCSGREIWLVIGLSNPLAKSLIFGNVFCFSGERLEIKSKLTLEFTLNSKTFFGWKHLNVCQSFRASLLVSTLQNILLLTPGKFALLVKKVTLFLIYKTNIKMKDYYSVLGGTSLLHALCIVMKWRQEWITFILCKWFTQTFFSPLSFLSWGNGKVCTSSGKA